MGACSQRALFIFIYAPEEAKVSFIYKSDFAI